MRIHLPGLPHSDITRAWDFCAFSAKTRRLTDMLVAQGHEPITYCGTEFDGSGEHVPVVTTTDLTRWFGGPWDHNRVFDRWNPEDPCWTEMCDTVIDAIKERLQTGDVIGITMGRCQQAIAEAFPGHIVAEVGVGYEGVLETTHHCFESQTWRHFVYGKRGCKERLQTGDVIPNSFDPDDYELGDDDGYLLFLGRHTARKGIDVVAELAKDHRVITAGQDGPIPGCEYRGLVLGAEKRELLAHASAVLVPTLYIEPFGGVAVESMLSGVPAITTSFGAFVETVENSYTGFRCDTLGEFHDAIVAAPKIRGPIIRSRAEYRFSTDVCAGLYDDWLRRLELLHGDGWYAMHPMT